ncbi:MAG: hypothetical protein IJC19_02600 [Clostridia bacterium]|nr:hypothetical protein [Clostridia bacterium]
MEQNYRFPRNELLKYRHIPQFVSGQAYLLVMASLTGKDPAQTRMQDFALRGKNSRDGLEAIVFTEASLRAKKTDRDLYWIVTDEGNNTVSLYSMTAKKYLVMDSQGARLSKKKQALTLSENGDFYQFSVEDAGKTFYLRASGHAESPEGLIFTSGSSVASSSFAFLQRIYGIPAKPAGEKKLTVGTVSDPHIDYGLQLFRPYLRKSVPLSAKAYKSRYDLDVMVTCGDNISDNGSGGYKYGGAVQGKWPRETFLKTQKLLCETVKQAFRDPEKSENILWMTGNHDTQVGDRQPEGQTFDSGDYSSYLSPNATHVLTEKVTDADIVTAEHILCYEVRVKGIPFLVLCTPRYPLDPRRTVPDRYAPAHTPQQAQWLIERLAAIERELGKNAVIFVSSHYPFYQWSFAPEGPECPDNREAFLQLYDVLNGYPNLIYFYGHVHGGDGRLDLRETVENSEIHSRVALQKNEDGSVTNADSFDRGYFRSDVIVGTGMCHQFVGSLAHFKTNYFANDGVKVNTWLCEIEVPFFQQLVAEVYEDRVVLTMENLGTKKGVYDHLPNATYKLKPLIVPLKK